MQALLFYLQTQETPSLWHLQSGNIRGKRSPNPHHRLTCTTHFSQILAAVLNRYFNFTAAYSPIFLNWYVGEVSTAVYVANIPLCWPLFRAVFHLDDWATKQSRRTGDSNSNSNYFSNRFRGNESTQGRPQRLHSDLDSEVEITGTEGQVTTSWEDNQSREELRLVPTSGAARYKTNVIGGRELGDNKSSGGDKENIVKTFQVSQYST